jgi:hypothetical protein
MRAKGQAGGDKLHALSATGAMHMWCARHLERTGPSSGVGLQLSLVAPVLSQNLLPRNYWGMERRAAEGGEAGSTTDCVCSVVKQGMSLAPSMVGRGRALKLSQAWGRQKE